MTLTELLSSYTQSRDLEPRTIEFYKRTISVFQRWHGRTINVDELSDDLVNGFLAELRAQDKKPHYRKSLRVGICALWKYAAKRKLVAAADDVAQVRIRRKLVHTWTASDVARLKSNARRLCGAIRGTTIPRGKYFATIITAAWYTGLSQVDLHRLKLSHFTGGKLTWTRSKTGGWVALQIPPADWREIEHYADIALIGDGLLWPEVITREGFSVTFRKIRDAAGLAGGFKTLRASAGTAYELANPGMGHVFLGNTRDIFMRNYYDPRREPNDLPSAPSLG